MFDEVALFKGVFDRVVMVAAWQLDYLVKTDMVELVSLLPVDPIDHHDKLAVVVTLAILLAFPSPIAVLSLVRGFGLGLALVFAKDCSNGLLAEGMAYSEVEQLLRHSQFAASKLMDECFVSHARDERPDHVHIHDVRKLIALLGKTVDVLA
jgi:hypothetical protein